MMKSMVVLAIVLFLCQSMRAEKYWGHSGVTSGYNRDLGASDLFQWSSASISWGLNENAEDSSPLSNSQIATLISKGYSQWVGGTDNLSTSYQGVTDNTYGNDGENVHYWVQDLSDPIYSILGAPGSGMGTAVAYVTEVNHVVEDADVIYEGYYRGNWNDGGSLDIWGISAHEIGHTIGLGHSDASGAVMTADGAGVQDRTLKTDDVIGASFIVDGKIIESQTITRELHFYWDISIASGTHVTLSGTSSVKFYKSSNLSIDGTLNIQGVLYNNKVFDFVSPSSSNGMIVNSGGSIYIDYCTSKNATFGLRLKSASSSTVDYSTFSNCIYGIYVDNCEPIISDCSVTNNSYGVYVKNSYDTPSTTEHITGNSIESNSSYGVYLYNSSPTLTDNYIYNNNNGMAMFTSCDSYMGGNEILMNDNYGLAIYGSSSPILYTRSGYPGGYNEIRYNDDDEVKITGTSDPDWGNSNYSGNNAIYDIDDYLMYNTTGNTINAEMNWWGSSFGPNTGLLYGSIDYDPFLTGSPKMVMNQENIQISSENLQSESIWNAAVEAYYNGSFMLAASLFESILTEKYDVKIKSRASNYYVKSILEFLNIDGAINNLSDLISKVGNSRIKAELLSIYSAYNERVGKYNDALSSLISAEKFIIDDKIKNRIRLQKAFLQLNNTNDRSSGIANLNTLMASLDSDSYLHEMALSLYETEEISLPKQNINNTSKYNPSNYVLYHNYPNPFNPSTNIYYQLTAAGHVTLKVYDMLGREVTELINSVKAPGRYEVQFDGSNLSSGTYIYQIVVDALGEGSGYSASKKMLLIK